MKHLVTWTVSLCFLATMNAQTFASIGTKWGYDYATPGGGGSKYLESVGDTLIEGKICRKLDYKEVSYICPTCQGIYCGTRIFYENNDSLFAVYGTEFRFLFSYRLAIGDTLKLKYNQNYVLVRKVDTLISGQTLKKWQMQSICSDPRYGKSLHNFVEKIGDLNGYIGLNYYCLSDPEYVSLCAFSSGNIQIGGICQYTNTKDITSAANISISPNPASSTLKVASNHAFKDIKIYDSAGKMYKNAFYTEGVSLDISTLPKGLYFLQLTDKEEFRVHRTFVKE